MKKLVLALLVIAIFGCTKEKKIVYVDSQELLMGYDGMSEASKALEEKSVLWQFELDSLKKEYESVKSSFLGETSEEDKLALSQQGQYLESLLAQKKKEYGELYQLEDEKLSKGVLNQVNSFVADYAKENGISMVLGSNGMGTIIYGDETMDITQDVLQSLNAYYNNEK